MTQVLSSVSIWERHIPGEYNCSRLFMHMLVWPCCNTCHVCSVGVFKNGRVEIIANDQGNRITPSYVAFTPDGERLIGDAAKNQLTINPENTVFDAKRLIGREWTDTAVQHDIKFFPFKVCVNFLHFNGVVFDLAKSGLQVVAPHF